ncbi:ABC transporter ATP-binding protein [Herbidospora mongoliensis]|uniref:ABC transporter ATP-binding protein n=1 Tax=Herbidospora mongoliensis TaxID=688067 RepID=UPI000829F82D|nr:ABC transporter ATP-binding protein [Herbidospora mongoliensis]
MSLRFENVSMAYQAGSPVLEEIDLDIPAGEFVTVVGASGSGKSTLLSLVAGLIRATEGRITLDGQEIIGPGPDRGMAFQSPSLYPWRTVAQNVAFGLETRGFSRQARKERVEWLLEEVGLTEHAGKLPGSLSGGQQQRVSIARALARSPKVLLLDEPFGALDVQTKEDMQLFIRQVWQDLGTTVVMVTHDVEEAVFLGRRVLVLASDPGRVARDLRVELSGTGLEVKRTAEFLTLRAQVEDLVRREHRAHLAAARA